MLFDIMYHVTWLINKSGGDASTRFLASFQDAEMATLKDSSRSSSPAFSVSASRGRDNYSLSGVLRTKPGRADSPPISCMSCSDKIAAWNFLGTQGALGSEVSEKPLYVDILFIRDVEDHEMMRIVHEDIDRSNWGRLQSVRGI